MAIEYKVGDRVICTNVDDPDESFLVGQSGTIEEVIGSDLLFVDFPSEPKMIMYYTELKLSKPKKILWL